MCKSWCESIIALIVIVLSLVPNMPQNWADWVILVVGVGLLIHSFSCKQCFDGKMSKKR